MAFRVLEFWELESLGVLGFVRFSELESLRAWEF